MKINSINNNIYARQNFKGIILRGKDAGVIAGDKKQIYDDITNMKDIDIHLFDSMPSKDGSTQVPVYSCIVVDKKSKTPLNGFKCTKDEQGLEWAQKKLKLAVIWANAPANLGALSALDKYKADDKTKDFAEKLDADMQKAFFSNESKVWRQKLDMLTNLKGNELEN